jgi:hypothetical protein
MVSSKLTIPIIMMAAIKTIDKTTVIALSQEIVKIVKEL